MKLTTYRVKLRPRDARVKRAWWEDVKPEQVADTLPKTIFAVRREAAATGHKVLRIRDADTNTDVYCIE